MIKLRRFCAIIHVSKEITCRKADAVKKITKNDKRKTQKDHRIHT